MVSLMFARRRSCHLRRTTIRKPANDSPFSGGEGGEGERALQLFSEPKRNVVADSGEVRIAHAALGVVLQADVQLSTGGVVIIAMIPAGPPAAVTELQ